MVSTRGRRLAALILVVLAAALAALVTAGTASADVVGTLTVDPASGADDTPMAVNTSGPCPSGNTIAVTIKGSGFPDAGFNIVGATPIANLETTGAGGYH